MYEEGGSRIVIGLAGYAQVGKDTIGQILVRDYGFTRISFADNVREAVYRLNPLVPIEESEFGTTYNPVRVQRLVEKYGWEVTKTQFPEVRRLLQLMGTEVGREMFGEHCWTDMALRQAGDLERVVFTDVRFSNEAEVVRGLGGSVWGVDRPGSKPVNDHASDRIDFDADSAIWNGGTVEELEQAVADAVYCDYGLQRKV